MIPEGLETMVNIGVVVAGAVWVVSQIKTSTSLLRQSITYLADEVKELNAKHDNHEQRLYNIELKQAKEAGRRVGGAREMTES